MSDQDRRIERHRERELEERVADAHEKRPRTARCAYHGRRVERGIGARCGPRWVHPMLGWQTARPLCDVRPAHFRLAAGREAEHG